MGVGRMSGGSYNYFYSRGPEELESIARNLESMAIDCEKPSTWALECMAEEGVSAKELATVGKHLRRVAGRVTAVLAQIEPLKEVMHDIEWWQSGDTGPGEVVRTFKSSGVALKSKRTRKGKRCPRCNRFCGKAKVCDVCI